MRYGAVVIGAGVNGLAAAVHLSAKGWKVAVLERAVVAGGAVKTAEVTLPLDAVQPAAEFDRSSLAGVEVLVVEANATHRAAIARPLALRRNGHRHTQLLEDWPRIRDLARQRCGVARAQREGCLSHHLRRFEPILRDTVGQVMKDDAWRWNQPRRRQGVHGDPIRVDL